MLSKILNALTLFFKALWKFNRELLSSARYYFFKSLPGVYFKSVGSGTKFYGPVRFGNVAGNISIGKKGMIGRDIFLSATNDSEIVFGDYCSINTGGHVVAAYGIKIGSGTRIGEYVTIRDQNHEFEDPNKPIIKQGFSGSPITIGDDVWIGRGACIAPGVTIGKGSVIGANSVVTRDIPEYSVAVGAPAKVVRKRGDKLKSSQK